MRHWEDSIICIIQHAGQHGSHVSQRNHADVYAFVYHFQSDTSGDSMCPFSLQGPTVSVCYVY